MSSLPPLKSASFKAFPLYSALGTFMLSEKTFCDVNIKEPTTNTKPFMNNLFIITLKYNKLKTN